MRRQIPGSTVQLYSEIAANGPRLVLVGYRLANSPSPGALIEWSEDAGATWQTATPNTSAAQLYGVAYGAGRFVAVGAGGVILSSPDGRTWTPATSGVTQILQRVHYANGRFVAVGLAGTVVVSTDGLTWQNRTIPRGPTLSRITYYRGRWLSFASGLLVTSPDGNEWTIAPANAQVTFQGFAQLGSSEVLFGCSSGDHLWLSEDGLAWASFDLPDAQTNGFLYTAVAVGNNVVAVGTGGRIFQSSLRSNVTTAPTIASAPRSQAASIGQPVTLSVQANGAGLTYEWRKNGTVIAGATGATYTIPAFRAEDAGSYTVTALNYGGTVTSTAATLSINTSTAWIAAMTPSRSIAAGTDLTLTVTAQGVAPVTYQWRKDGVVLPGATEARLPLGQVTPEQAGSYTVIVTDAGFTVTSEPTVLTVTGELPFMVSTLAGLLRVPGANDGVGTAARFVSMGEMAIDAAGFIYLSDRQGHTIRRISPSGVVTTLAGRPGLSGFADGTGTGAQFNLPNGLAVDRAGNVYVADTNNNRIRKVTPAGVVTTLAGQAQGAVDGSGTAARLGLPQSLTIDRDGNLYCTESLNHTVRKITPAGFVTTVAGLARTTGTANGPGAEARFNNPGGITVDGEGNLYVADTNNHVIRHITPDGTVSTYAGQMGTAVTADGPIATTGRLSFPGRLAFDPAGNLFFTSSTAVRRISAAGLLSTPIGALTATNHADGLGNVARFASLTGIAIDPVGNIFLSDGTNFVIRKAVLLGRKGSRLANLSVRSFAGTGSDTLIVGFSVGGGTKSLLVRAVGPTLGTLGVDGALANPTLQLDANNATVARNDDWFAPATGDAAAIANAAALIGAFPLPASSRDAALLQSLAAGGYTAQVGGGAGVALVEVYDTSAFSPARLGNVSARTRAGTGNDTLIVGFVVAGDSPRTVLIRAIGPTLGAFGVSGALANPRLELNRDTMLVATNAGWAGDAALAATFGQVGAFALPADSRDAALLVSLLPGAYTAQVTPASGGPGNVLVEIYDVP